MSDHEVCDELLHMADFSDYQFLREPFQGWILNGYCVTLVADTSAEEFLQLVDAEIWPDRVRGYEEMNLAWPSTSDHYVGVADLPGRWTLIIETAAGHMGISEYVLGPVAAKMHDIVSIYGAEGSGRIEWWTDGILVAHMDVSYLEYDGAWSGADPRRFEDVWNAVVPDDLDDRVDSGWVFPQALFAAAENITGIHLSQEVLASSEFKLATVRAILPPAAGEYTRRLRDAGWDARALHP